LVTPFLLESDILVRAEGEERMFNVYLNEKRDRVLVIPRGRPIPVIESAGGWLKKKRTVAVSEEIKSAIQRNGFYWRKLRKSNSLKNNAPTATAQRPRRNDIGTSHADAGHS
jgi:hypothetical protein